MFTEGPSKSGRRKKLNHRMKSFSVDCPDPPKAPEPITSASKKKSSSFTNACFGGRKLYFFTDVYFSGFICTVIHGVWRQFDLRHFPKQMFKFPSRTFSARHPFFHWSHVFSRIYTKHFLCDTAAESVECFFFCTFKTCVKLISLLLTRHCADLLCKIELNLHVSF